MTCNQTRSPSPLASMNKVAPATKPKPGNTEATARMRRLGRNQTSNIECGVRVNYKRLILREAAHEAKRLAVWRRLRLRYSHEDLIAHETQTQRCRNKASGRREPPGRYVASAI